MLYVQNFNCAFVSVIGEVKTIEKLTESNLEEGAHFQNSAVLFLVNLVHISIYIYLRTYLGVCFYRAVKTI